MLSRGIGIEMATCDPQTALSVQTPSEVVQHVMGWNHADWVLGAHVGRADDSFAAWCYTCWGMSLVQAFITRSCDPQFGIHTTVSIWADSRLLWMTGASGSVPATSELDAAVVRWALGVVPTVVGLSGSRQARRRRAFVRRMVGHDWTEGCIVDPL